MVLVTRTFGLPVVLEPNWWILNDGQMRHWPERRDDQLCRMDIGTHCPGSFRYLQIISQPKELLDISQF